MTKDFLDLPRGTVQWGGWWVPDPSETPWGVLRVGDSEFGSGWVALQAPRRIARTVDEALDMLDNPAGLAAGLFAYEASAIFEPCAEVQTGDPLTVWFGEFTLPLPFYKWLPDSHGTFPDLTPEWSRKAYGAAFRKVRDHLAKGDTYQVNLTFRMRGQSEESLWNGFCSVCAERPPDYAAFFSLPDREVACLSPELFFLKQGSHLTAKPMKGTEPRGLSPAEDMAHAEALRNRAKDRAENLMIVDMVRNDLGRVARPGSVVVPRLFDVQALRSQFQMTSTVTAESDRSTSEVLRALFPCASIVGAPKIETQRIIARLEPSPRGAYTGAIGFALPNGDAQFAVSIRTATRDRGSRTVEYGVGGGIVWDSREEAEWTECLLKAKGLQAKIEPFALLETMLMRGGVIDDLDDHLDRMEASAAVLDLPFDRTGARRALDEASRPGEWRVRLLMERHQVFRVELGALAAVRAPLRAAVCAYPVRSADPALKLKTNRRELYERVLAEHPGVDEVLLWNERGEVTEFLIGNAAVRLGGKWLTPPIASGLLPGVTRARLLAAGELREKVVRLEELRGTQEIARINSVSGWCAVIIEGLPGESVADPSWTGQGTASSSP